MKIMNWLKKLRTDVVDAIARWLDGISDALRQRDRDLEQWLSERGLAEVWHGDRSTIHLSEGIGSDGGRCYTAYAWFQNTRGRSQTFQATGRSQEEAIENLHKLVEESPVLYWQD